MATMSNKQKQKPKLEPTLFNSKLYINVDFKEENLSTYSNSEESEQINKSPSQKKLNQYLSKDLLDELELSNPVEKKFSEKIFIAKKFQNEEQLKENNDVQFPMRQINYCNNGMLVNQLKNSNPLLSLINQNYEFLPKNFNNNNKNNFFTLSSNYNNNIKKMNYNEYQKRKIYNKIKGNDWVCSFCKNLNYSFRVKCNRCNSLREVADILLIKLLEQQKNEPSNLYMK